MFRYFFYSTGVTMFFFLCTPLLRQRQWTEQLQNTISNTHCKLDPTSHLHVHVHVRAYMYIHVKNTSSNFVIEQVKVRISYSFILAAVQTGIASAFS